MDMEQRHWCANQLREKSLRDQAQINRIFIFHYAKLLDSTIRKHTSRICKGCKEDDVHICRLPTGNFTLEAGAMVILREATDDEQMRIWRSFIKDISHYFKADIMIWISNFPGVCKHIELSIHDFVNHMCDRFPNGADEPEGSDQFTIDEMCFW